MTSHDYALLAIDKVVIRNDRDEHLVFLRQIGGEIVFPIAVGLYEAAAVKGALDDPVSSRPLTHELVYAVTKALGGEIRHVLIEALIGSVFFAKIALRTRAGEAAEIDCRPSDALCVARDAGVPIYATTELLGRISSS